MNDRFLSLSNDSFCGVLWAFLYGLLVVVISPLAVSMGVSRYVIATLVLIALPTIASLLVRLLAYLAGQRP